MADETARFEKVAILGDGAMATACALLLDSRGLAVTMWSPFEDYARQLAQTYENERYLPGIPLSRSIRITAEESAAVDGADLIVSAIPTQYKRAVWQQFADQVAATTPIVSVAKGIENKTLLRPSQIIEDVLGGGPSDPEAPDGPHARGMAVMSGPSVASELARCLPATVCVSANHAELAPRLQQTFITDWFRVYTNDDMLGVELAGATKNVIALAAGILDGLQAGFNAKSALLSRGLAEITRLGVALGASAETFFGITGVGDLATTCFSPTGRNRSAGEMLGKGAKLSDVIERISGVVEGVPTTRSVMALARQVGVEMPITAAIHAVLFDGLDPIEGISRLMSREPKAERLGV